MTASFGVAVKDDLQTADELVAVADEALYAAKRAGKNRVMPNPEDARRSQSSRAPEAEEGRRYEEADDTGQG